MFVSVIIPSFGQSRFLGAAIKSVLQSDYLNFELVVVDDCGTDASLAIARAAAADDARVRVVKRHQNGGLGSARNTGIAWAKGELLTFLDADDCLYPNGISARVDAYRESRENDPSIVGVFGDWQHTTELVHLPKPRSARVAVADVNRASFTGDNAFICSAPLVSADAVRTAGGFPEGLPLFEDFALWARIIADGGVFKYTPAMVSTYRQRSGSMLRRSDVIGADYTAHIVSGLKPEGLSLVGQGALRSMCAGERPQTSGRLAWMRSTRFPHQRDAFAGSAESILEGNDLADEVAINLGPIELDFMRRRDWVPKNATDVSHELRTHSLDVSLDGGRVTVLVPYAIEDALEVVAIVKGAPESERLVVAIPPDVDLEAVWPIAELRVPIIKAAEAISRLPMARWLLFGHDVGVRGDLFRQVTKPRCVLRTAGLMPLRVLDSGAARRFRQASRILVRSRLEGAELGDRPVEFLPSGARLGLDIGRTGDGPIIVYLPADFFDRPAADPWLSAVARCVSEASSDPIIMVPFEPDAATPGFAYHPLDFRSALNAERIVLPQCDEISLFEALGVPITIFEPSDGAAMSSTWLRHAACVRSAPDLAACLSADSTDVTQIAGFESGLARIQSFEGSAQQFSAAILELVWIDSK